MPQFGRGGLAPALMEPELFATIRTFLLHCAEHRIPVMCRRALLRGTVVTL